MGVPADLVRIVHCSGRRLRFIPLGRGKRHRIDDEDDDPLHVVERRWHALVVQGFEDRKRVQHAAHAHVVGHPAVHEMDVGPLGAVEVGFTVP